MKLFYKEVIYNITIGKIAFQSHNMAMLYRNTCYSEACYNKVELYNPSTSEIRNFEPLAIFCGCRARLVSYMAETPETGFLMTWLILGNLSEAAIPKLQELTIK